MTMTVLLEIKNRIQELGGSIDPDSSSLQAFLLRVRFPHHLYYEHRGFHGIDELLEQHQAVYEEDVEAFLDLVEQHYFTDRDFACGQDFWEPVLFTPLTPGSADQAEWESWFADYADLSPIRAVCGEGELQFVRIVRNYRYPDQFYICLQDPQPENPTVFGTDHEAFFQEISVRGRFSDFLNIYCTRADFRELVREELQDAS